MEARQSPNPSAPRRLRNLPLRAAIPLRLSQVASGLGTPHLQSLATVPFLQPAFPFRLRRRRDAGPQLTFPNRSRSGPAVFRVWSSTAPRKNGGTAVNTAGAEGSKTPENP